jgi:hypothetical protein
VVDLEVAAFVAAGNDAGRVARFERGPQRCRDRSSCVRDATDVDTVRFNRLYGSARGQSARGVDADRANPGDPAGLSDLGPSAGKRLLRHMDMNDRLRCARAVGEGHQRICCVCL